jgi:hypothetical protein
MEIPHKEEIDDLDERIQIFGNSIRNIIRQWFSMRSSNYFNNSFISSLIQNTRFVIVT